MSKKTIEHVQKCFNYAVSQNKGKTDGLRASLKALVHHLYDDHTHCKDQEWCRNKDDPKRGFPSLPRGQPLSDLECKPKLEALFEQYAKQAEKLVAAGSTQRNENFNQIVSTKHPKNKHYAGS